MMDSFFPIWLSLMYVVMYAGLIYNRYNLWQIPVSFTIAAAVFIVVIGFTCGHYWLIIPCVIGIGVDLCVRYAYPTNPSHKS